jgi:octaprenyl-diphosphate synthase
VIRERLASRVALIDQISRYIVSAGGKRIRPRLVLLFAEALGFDGPSASSWRPRWSSSTPPPCCTTTWSTSPRCAAGRATANAMFGNAASVLVGDFLYSRAFQMMVSVNRMRVLEVLADATNVIAEGEVLQLMNMHDPDLAVETTCGHPLQDRQAVRGQRAPGRGAGRGRRGHVEEACADYGRALGTAFQLVDDLLDYEGNTDQLGKNVGDDLREGKPTCRCWWRWSAARLPRTRA